MKPMAAHSSEHSHSPIYIKLAHRLRQQIEDGEIASGEALPSERDLCKISGASRVTVRKAIELLIEEGLLSRRQGSGTYVTPRIQAPGSFLSSFSEDAEARGEATDTIWIMKVIGAPTEDAGSDRDAGPQHPVGPRLAAPPGSGRAVPSAGTLVPGAGGRR